MITKENAGLNWIGGWIALVDNLTILISFGYVLLGLEFKFICWRVRRGALKAKLKRERVKIPSKSTVLSTEPKKRKKNGKEIRN